MLKFKVQQEGTYNHLITLADNMFLFARSDGEARRNCDRLKRPLPIIDDDDKIRFESGVNILTGGGSGAGAGAETMTGAGGTEGGAERGKGLVVVK